MKRVLLTGIGGSIGCHTMCHIMHNTNWELVGIDSFRHKGLTDRVEGMLVDHKNWRRRLKLFTHDLTAPISELLAKKIGPIDHVINMASLSDVFASIVDPAPFMRANTELMLTMLEYARQAKPKVFLQISTDEVYGPTDGVHLHKEWDPMMPSNAYSASKVAQEAAGIAYWRTYNVPLVIVNMMNNFGEMQSAAKFPVIIQRKVAQGETIHIHGDKQHMGSRCYIHSRNASDAFLFILKNVQPHMHVAGTADKPERFNIVGDQQISNLDLAKMIADMMGKPLKYKLEGFTAARPGHDAHYGLDGSKLAALGWKSPLDFATSLRNTVEWQDKHPEWLEPSK